MIEKLTGDNTKDEKERVMKAFREGWVQVKNQLILSNNEKLSRLCRVLVCTDVAGMGLDTQDLNLSINIGNIFYSQVLWEYHSVPGIPKSSWKAKQQSGRIGRGGEDSVDVTFAFPQKGESFVFTYTFSYMSHSCRKCCTRGRIEKSQ